MIERIRAAFAEVVLGDGIGLHQYVNDCARDRFSLLTSEQRSVVAEYLKYCLTDADDFIRPMIEDAWARYWSFERP